jgi:hypothetical protein
VSSWLYHLAHIDSLDPADARFKLLRFYLDAFWWWGYYEPFPFCDVLIHSWERVVVPAHRSDEHVRFLRYLRLLHARYPRGWEKAGTDMGAVDEALTGLATLAGLDPGTPLTSYGSKDEEHLHVHALLHLFFAHCALYRSSVVPIPDNDFDDAKAHYETAYAAFVRVRESCHSHADEWNEAWTLYELADLHASHHQFDAAAEYCDRAQAREYERVEEAAIRHEADPDEEKEHVLDELLADIARVRADVAQRRGDIEHEARQRAQAVFHAYASQVRPPQATPCEEKPGRYEGGPDAYTTSFYEEMRERAVNRIVELHQKGRAGDARMVAEQLASFWDGTRSKRAERELAETLARFADGCPPSAELMKRLFPPAFDEGDLDEYVERGLKILACVQRSGG